MTYSEKLRDPRWQRKRLEILNRDEFTCQNCGDNNTTLHIHHRLYLKNKDPWDYESNLLITLCEICHSQESESIDFAINELTLAVKSKFLSHQILAISDGFKEYENVHTPEVCADAISFTLKDRRCLEIITELYLEYLNKKNKVNLFQNII